MESHSGCGKESQNVNGFKNKRYKKKLQHITVAAMYDGILGNLIYMLWKKSAWEPHEN